MKRQIYLLSALTVVILSAFLVASLPSEKVNFEPSIDEKKAVIQYGSLVQYYLNGEEFYADPNTLYDDGADALYVFLTTGAGAAFDYISLGNGSIIGGGDPTADTYDEYTSCGLTAAQGSVEARVGVGNWSIVKTFTASTSSPGCWVNVSRIENSTGGDFAGNNFTGVNMTTSDQVTVNHTLWINSTSL